MLAFLTLAASPGDLAPQQLDEYQVKAAFLFHFAQFVDWPAGTFASAEGPFTICVLGEDGFRETLADTVAGKTLSGRAVRVLAVTDATQIRACRMLFITAQPDKHQWSVLAEAGLTSAGKRPGILTVGDAQGATSGALIIGFLMDNGKVRFEIDAAAAERAGLHLSAKLLSLAQGWRK